MTTATRTRDEALSEGTDLRAMAEDAPRMVIGYRDKARIKMLPTPSDMTGCSIDWAVHEYVDEFGAWPEAVVAASNANEHAEGRARDLGLKFYVFPEPICAKPDSWMVSGRQGSIWSPGA